MSVIDRLRRRHDDDVHDRPLERRTDVIDRDDRADHGDGRPYRRRVRDLDDREVIAATRERYGGADVAASFAGGLAAIGATVLLAGIVAGATEIAYRLGADASTEDISIAAAIAGAAVLVLAFLFGGWVAGRMARYDGARNGLVAGLWFLLVLAIAGALGAWIDQSYDFTSDANLPDWFSGDAATVTGMVSGVIVAVLGLLAAMLGGSMGSRYHRHADDALLATSHGREVVVDRSDDRVHDDRGVRDDRVVHDDRVDDDDRVVRDGREVRDEGDERPIDLRGDDRDQRHVTR